MADGVEQILPTRGYFQQLGQLGFGELDHGAHPAMIARQGKVIFFKLAKPRSMNEERIKTLQQLLKMDPDDVFSEFALGLEFLESDPGQAERHFRLTLDKDDRYVAGYFQLGKLAFDQGDEKAATDWLEKGIAVAEEVGDAHAAGEMQDFLDQM